MVWSKLIHRGGVRDPDGWGWGEGSTISRLTIIINPMVCTKGKGWGVGSTIIGLTIIIYQMADNRRCLTTPSCSSSQSMENMFFSVGISLKISSRYYSKRRNLPFLCSVSGESRQIMYWLWSCVTHRDPGIRSFLV